MLVPKICCRMFVMSEGDTPTTKQLTNSKEMEKVLNTTLAIVGNIFLAVIGLSVLAGVFVALSSI
jgi:hypothetical protein